jgi:uncharacterized membrane protein YkvA (DUF1232 family)
MRTRYPRPVRTLVVVVVVSLATWLVAIGILVVAGHRTRARELAGLVPNLVRLFRGLVADPRVPRGAKAWLWVALVWLVSPIDLVPEFVPIAGPLDDAIVAALVLRHVVSRTDRTVLDEHWHGDPSTLETILRVARIR